MHKEYKEQYMKRYAKVIAVAVAVLGIVIFTVKPQAAAVVSTVPAAIPITACLRLLL